MIALLIAQAMTMPPPPPVYVVGRNQASTDAAMPAPVSIEIVMRGGDRIVWQGALRVSARGASSWRQIVAEPVPAGCPGERDWNGQSSETSIQISPTFRGNDAPGEYAISVRWQRPAEGECGGTRTVELRQTVVFAGRQPIVLSGDGGLIVELRRR